MPDFLTSAFNDSPQLSPLDVFVRLVVAFALGGVVATIYRLTRKSTEIIASFPTTLVLLTIIIAMVTQVIGDNVARAFSLVGALSIVRFRTVVRDTQDTAYVIFAVVVGMAVGAHNLWVTAIGIPVVAAASFWRHSRLPRVPHGQPAYVLTLRVPLGLDPAQLAGSAFERHIQDRELISVGTARQGSVFEFIYETRLRPVTSPEAFVKELNQLEEVQDVEIRRRNVNSN